MNSTLQFIMKAALGGMGAQAIQFLSIPLLARIYSPNDFAIYALWMAGLLLWGSISTFRYELALVIPKDRQEASDVFWGAMMCVGGMTVIGSALFSLPTVRQLLGLFGDQHSWLSVFPVTIGIGSMGSMMLLAAWANREDRFGLNASAQVLSTVVTFIFQVGWIASGWQGAWGLIWGTIAGYVTSAAITAVGLRKRKQLPNSPSRPDAIGLALHCHYRFLLFSTPKTILGLVRDRGALVVIEKHVALSEVGNYAMIQRLVNFPVNLVSGAIRPVLYTRMANEGLAANEQRIALIHLFLLFVSTPWLAIAMVFADDIAPFMLGPQWSNSGDLLRILIWPCYILMYVNWMDRIMDIKGKQGLALVIEGLFSAVAIATLAISLAYSHSLHTGLLAISITSSAVYLITWIAYYKMANYSIWRLFAHASLALAVYILFHHVASALTHESKTVATSGIIASILAFYALCVPLYKMFGKSFLNTKADSEISNH